jgi:hypothetical protein
MPLQITWRAHFIATRHSADIFITIEKHILKLPALAHNFDLVRRFRAETWAILRHQRFELFPEFRHRGLTQCDTATPSRRLEARKPSGESDPSHAARLSRGRLQSCQGIWKRIKSSPTRKVKAGKVHWEGGERIGLASLREKLGDA